MSNVLQLENIDREFSQGGNKLQVLRNLNLNISTGEMVALTGPSGSGKSTLLQIAGLLDTPTSGRVVLAGQDCSQAGDALRTRTRRHHIGFIYQFHHLQPDFTAEENVMIPQLIASSPVAKARQRARELLEQLGLQDRLDHRPARLSGGEQQRVAIARALANKPRLLLADEPTGNLDPETSEHVFSIFLATAREQGVGVLLATHNLDLAKRMDRHVRLNNGRLELL